MAISPQRLTIYLYSAHRAVIFAIAQLSCLSCDELQTERRPLPILLQIRQSYPSNFWTTLGSPSRGRISLLIREITFTLFQCMEGNPSTLGRTDGQTCRQTDERTHDIPTAIRRCARIPASRGNNVDNTELSKYPCMKISKNGVNGFQVTVMYTSFHVISGRYRSLNMTTGVI